MTHKRAGSLLANYPVLYKLVTERREQVLHSYRASLGTYGRRGGGGYSDHTAKRAVKLAGNI